MFLGVLRWSIRLGPWSWVVLSAMAAAQPLPAQEPIRLPPQPVTITPAFAPEGLPNQFEEGAALPAAMSTAGGGDTWIACLAYSPDGSTLAVGDRPTRPICTFLGDAPVNQNGGLIRIIDIASRRVTRTIRPKKRPRYEYEVVCLAYTPDGRTLLAHGIEGWPSENRRREYGYHVTAFDAETGRSLRRIDSAKLDDWKLPFFSRNASAFAALTRAGIRVWDIVTGRERPAPEGAPTKPVALALSPDARVLAAGDNTGEFCLWDAASGRRIARFPGHRKDGSAYEVEFLTFSPDGQILAVGGQLAVEVREFPREYHSEVRLVNMATRTERTVIPGVRIAAAAFSPDGKTLATASSDGPDDDAHVLLTLWDPATAKPRTAARRTRTRWDARVAYSSDGASLVMADREWIELHDPVDGRERAFLYQGWFTSREEAIALAPDGRTVASSNGRFQLWDLRAAVAPPTGGGHRFEVTCLAYAPDGRILASGSFDWTVKLWDVAARRPKVTLVGHVATIVRIAYAPDGRAVASADALGKVRLWDVTTGTCRLTLKGPDAPPWLLAFAPDGRALCLIAARYERPFDVYRWDAATGDRLPSPRLAADAPRPLAFSSDGARCISAAGRRVRVWDAGTGALRAEFTANGESLGLLVASDGETVFQKTPDESVVTYRRAGETWSAEDLFASSATSIAMGKEAAGEHMTLSPDGRRLAVNVDGSVQVFDTATRRTIARLPTSDEAASWLAFSPDGASLATGRTDGGVFVYSLRDTAAPVAHP
jgi:WD40 repeat protein